METRTCKKCLGIKSLDDFPKYINSSGNQCWRHECSVCVKSRMTLRLTRPDAKAAALASKIKSAERLWQETLDAYGRVCKCCGESEPDFLCIDHINDDGNTERAILRPTEPKTFGGKTYYTWLRQQGWPQHVQLLCFNCNFAKARRRGCPHKRLKVMPNG